MRTARVTAFFLVVLAVSMLCILPATASDSSVSKNDVMLVSYGEQLQISAGSSDSFRIEIVNLLSYAENDISNYRMVSVEFVPLPEITISVDEADRDFVLEGQMHRSVRVTVDVDKYAAAAEYEIGIVLKVMALGDGTVTETTDPVLVKLVVLSPLSSGDSFNRILGIFDNPLPDPFNTPLASAIITFFLWIIIGILIMLVLTPLIVRIVVRGNEEEGKSLKSGLRILIPLVLVLYAFDEGLRVYGAGEEMIGTVEMWFNMFYIILGAIISWKIYLAFVQYTISKISKNKRIDQKDVDIEPLLRLLGKLVIAVMSVALIMSAWGFDLTAIITSAGIISLGITFGAQSVLSQFFSGMVLLMTRPFKSGDLVRIGDTKTIYRVSCVNIMNTVFENWDNKETVIMPNNAVSSSTIVNLTGDGLIYKVTVFMNIAYDNNIDLAKELMENAAVDHPNVITNGSVDMPSTRVTAFLDSAIEIRLTGYVYDFNDSGRIGGELREAIFKSFKENGISVPFPQMDVHLDAVRGEDLRK
ncbi:MAG: mechanosensitive ion channel [Methanomassiliicoccaceae archaeon]|jgi:small-conductance mechanosensitive channel|nr:mechanosensitive ion channel [Methanomassiliicoccaceae archaeon]